MNNLRWNTLSIKTLVRMKEIFRTLRIVCVCFLLTSCESACEYKLEIETPDDDFMEAKTVTGRIVDSQGIPAKDVEVEFYYALKYSEYTLFYIPTNYRLKATATTDDNGVYRLSVKRRADEGHPKENFRDYYFVSRNKQNDPKKVSAIEIFYDCEKFWDTPETVVQEYKLENGSQGQAP